MQAISKHTDEPYYKDDELQNLLKLSKEVQDRMRVKVSESYFNHALKVPDGAKEPHPIFKVIMPDSREVDDLNGEIDPSNQNRYSPLPGLLHKYGMLLAFTSINCSSHCRYCYRLDLFNGSSKKEKADMQLIAAYIKTFNSLVDDAIKDSSDFDNDIGLWVHKDTKEPLTNIREILFSGGDPMTLPNSTIARYMVLMAEAGIQTIRFGTKDLVFHPQRFDKEFWQMMDLFHQNYPDVRVNIVGHYVHPFELLDPKINNAGKYIYDINLRYKIREDLLPALEEINKRSEWIGHLNQFPIIAGINDSPDIIRLLVYQSTKMGIQNHNTYACREIVGNKHFRQNNTIERQYNLVEKAKSGLSGIENHIRLIMSTEYGKMEVCSIDGPNISLKINRFVNENQPQSNSVMVDTSKLKGEKFYWLTDDVIKIAVSDEGKKALSHINAEGQSFIKQLKKLAANKVQNVDVAANSQPLPGKSTTYKKPCATKLEIEVVTNKGSRIIEVDFANEIKTSKSLTLATILSRDGVSETTCGEKLSCSTCVGDVQSTDHLTKPSEDEEDLIDVVRNDLDKNNSPSNSPKNLRATCQIEVKQGESYKFTPISSIKNNDDNKSRL